MFGFRERENYELQWDERGRNRVFAPWIFTVRLSTCNPLRQDAVEGTLFERPGAEDRAGRKLWMIRRPPTGFIHASTMDDLDKVQGTRLAEGPAAMRFSWGVRFSPHVIVFLLTLLATIPPLRGAIVSGVYWWWNKTYAQAEYVMDEARPNDGYPYIAGHLAGSNDQHNLVGLMQGTTMLVKALP
jgi:hypothetical protein